VTTTPRVILFDVGGVLATNGWDRHARRAAADRFGYDWEEFQDRHDSVAHDFETGALTRPEYLERTLFYRTRDFTAGDFTDFMESRTEPFPDSLAIVAELSRVENLTLATLNNESRELNEHRIDALGLKDHFSFFLSSCYLGVSKPEPEIYRIAIDVTQHSPDECLFIDDRPLNLECADLAGMQTHHFTAAENLRSKLESIGLIAR
jgi:putative hydrolase of the HAD superfamily